jgi:chromosome segregation ATPase
MDHDVCSCSVCVEEAKTTAPWDAWRHAEAEVERLRQRVEERESKLQQQAGLVHMKRAEAAEAEVTAWKRRFDSCSDECEGLTDKLEAAEAKIAEIGRLKAEGVQERKYTNNYIKRLHAAEAEVARLSKMCCVCEGDCCRLAKERKVEIEQWREALSFAEGCIPAQIMLALRLSGMPENRATVAEIAAWLRAALAPEVK